LLLAFVKFGNNYNDFIEMNYQRPNSPLREKSYKFAVEIVKLCQKLVREEKEFVLSRQLLKSGTAIGALIREAEFASSKPDFINKLTVSLKEANETEYWLMLLNDTGYFNPLDFDSYSASCRELIKMLTSSVNTAKLNSLK